MFWLYSIPDIPRATLEARYATPPSRFLVLGEGTRAHYRDRGARGAPVVLLLHGFSSSLFVWEYWSNTLSDRYRVISLDLPGSGLTGAVAGGDYSQGAMTEFVKSFADRLGLHRFALAGNSMGGGIAARFAELCPERVTALVLIDAPGAVTVTRPRSHFLYYLADTPLLSNLYTRFARVSDLNRMEGTRAAMLAHFRLPDDHFVWEHVRAIKAPTLIQWGGRDTTIAVASAHAWAKAIPGSRLVIYPMAGHVSMADAPRQSVADIRAFLEAVLH